MDGLDLDLAISDEKGVGSLSYLDISGDCAPFEKSAFTVNQFVDVFYFGVRQGIL
jgi:hypothetical protein